MASPSELEHGTDALHLSPVEDLCVWNLVLPFDVEQPPEASHMEGIELFLQEQVGTSPLFSLC